MPRKPPSNVGSGWLPEQEPPSTSQRSPCFCPRVLPDHPTTARGPARLSSTMTPTGVGAPNSARTRNGQSHGCSRPQVRPRLKACVHTSSSSCTKTGVAMPCLATPCLATPTTAPSQSLLRVLVSGCSSPASAPWTPCPLTQTPQVTQGHSLLWFHTLHICLLFLGLTAHQALLILTVPPTHSNPAQSTAPEGDYGPTPDPGLTPDHRYGPDPVSSPWLSL